MSSIWNFLFGKEGKTEQLPAISPEQQQLLNQLLSGIGGPLGAGFGNLQQLLSGDPEAFEAFQAPARTAFEQQTVPGIAERFTGAGAQSSSAFGQTLGQAGANLEEQLSAQRAGLQSQAMQQLQGLLGTGLGTKPFGYETSQPTQGFLGGLAPGIGMGIGGGAMGGMGGLMDLFKKIFGGGSAAGTTTAGV